MTEENATAPDQECEVYEKGNVMWHSSEEEGPPDVGISIGLGDRRMLWAGEISNADYEAAKERLEAYDDGLIMPSNFGWWIVLQGPGKNESVVIGRCLSEETARALMDGLQAVLRLSPRQELANRLLAERERQITEEGFSTERDQNLNANGELAFAAASYALIAAERIVLATKAWPLSWGTHLRSKYVMRPPMDALVAAGACILAEMERREAEDAKNAK